MVVVEFLLFFLVDREMASDFFADHFSGDDLVFLRLLEVFPGDSLLFGFLLQGLQRIELHVFAHLVKLFDQVGIGGDTQILAFFKQELLVDEIPKDVLFTVGIDLVGVIGVLLLDFITKLVFAARKLRLGNDLIVNPSNDFFDDLASREKRHAS